MRQAFSSLLGLSVIGTLAATNAPAQPVGEGPLVLRLPASARIAAMANAGVASTDGDAMFYNPGMLASSRGSVISMQRYGAAATSGSMGTTSTAGSLTVGIGAQFVTYLAPAGASYGDVVKTGATHLADGGEVSASSTAFTFGLARTIKGLRLGASVKYAEDRLGAAHDGTVAFDIGMNRALGPGTLAVVMQNLGAGPRLNGIKGTLPRRIGVGFGGYQSVAGHWDVGAQMALTLEGDLFVRPAGGAEVAYVPIEGVAITLRQGFRLPRERDESLVTAGLGVTIDRIAIDYAMEPMRGGRPVAHRVGLRIR
ncbi:MAG: hypothetical protein IPP90_02370 [Gemmatimonadaceae bacterium]|nr:hypothetical protein [Gemmatimonadaceae bacterium]